MAKIHPISESECGDALRKKLDAFVKEHAIRAKIESRGRYLAVQIYRHEKSEENRKTALICQGRGECMLKYAQLFMELYEAGLDVVSFDMPKQGESKMPDDPALSYSEDFGEYTDAIGLVSKVFAPCPDVAIAHSMGGLALLLAQEQGLITPKKTILAAPMLKLPTKGLPFPIAKVAASAAQMVMGAVGKQHTAVPGQETYKRPDFENNGKTHSWARLNFYHDIYAEHPELALGGVTWGWYSASLAAIPLVINPGQTPTLILLAGDDTVVDNANLQPVEPSAKDLVFFETIEGAWHDLFNETDRIRNKVLAKIEEFAEL